MSNVRVLREHAPDSSDTVENRLRMRGMWSIVERVCAQCYVLPLDVVGPGYHRTSELSRARHMLWATIAKECDYSNVGIGRLFGVDSTTVLMGIRAYRQRVE